MDQTFGKEFKLCGKTSIDALFQEGKTIKSFPIKLIFRKVEMHAEQKFLFVVPKKMIRKAHDRNYLKRCMREIVRKNKAIFTEQETSVHVGILYLQQQRLPYKQLEQKLVNALSMFANKLKND
ncbi:MAG TPA: ribonuclease P protein component [Crocinitomicaceae bacterium]|jgi:ribonuclease P protein component|nr:ribonuclease P protein component [Flavobacteriales bacterium]HBW85786.1 ribonuclease P protein component [Crocinitomicaceae bacterium]